jgi:predicted dehydrogenase
VNGRVSRRAFVRAGSAAAAAALAPRFAFSIVRPAQDRPIRFGLVGCGGRGTGAAEDCLKSAPNVEVVALADVFPDRLEGCRAQLAGLSHPGFKVAEGRCFTGFDAYRRLLEGDLDLVLLATPPGFRPIHFEAAVEAGRHVFMEKPVAVDPAGVRRVLAAGEKAKAKGLAVVAGTQRRHQKCYVETIRRIHEGAIGRIVAARCFWNQGGLWRHDRKEGESDVEWQMRNWLYFTWLSGDHIVEQHVHNLDVINWALRAHPVSAVAVGGRQVRTEPVYGHIYDHFCVDYEYPDGVHATSMCRQQPGTDGRIGEAVVGTEGQADPAEWIEGKSPWRWKEEPDSPYVQEHADLIASVRSGAPLNEARAVAESTLTAILGREAAYTGKKIAWDEILASGLDLSPAAYEFGPLPVAGVPIPGKSA